MKEREEIEIPSDYVVGLKEVMARHNTLSFNQIMTGFYRAIKAHNASPKPKVLDECSD